MNYKTIDINIIKKNRKYFAAEINNRKVQLEIDRNSENLELGEHTLYVEDFSIRNKYGATEKYKLVASLEKQYEDEVYTLKSTIRNKALTDACRKLGAIFDKETNTWVFNCIVSDKAEELDFVYNSELIGVEITAINEIEGEQQAIHFCGFTVAQAKGRDSGAKLGESVYMIEGDMSSGGSAKNWTTTIEQKSVFRLRVPEKLLKQEQESEAKIWDIKII
jgi:hypothetical protein